jgi:hypothetical protein
MGAPFSTFSASVAMQCGFVEEAPEVMYQTVLFGAELTPADLFLRLVIENDPLGAPLNMYLQELSQQTGETQRLFLIPQGASMSNVSVFGPVPAAGVSLAPVEAEVAEDSEVVQPHSMAGSDD